MKSLLLKIAAGLVIPVAVVAFTSHTFAQNVDDASSTLTDQSQSSSTSSDELMTSSASTSDDTSSSNVSDTSTTTSATTTATSTDADNSGMSNTGDNTSSENTGSSVTSGLSGQLGANPVGSLFELFISSAGDVIVRGVRVTGVTDNVIHGSSTLGVFPIEWSVLTSSSTGYARRPGAGLSSLSEIQPGDYISFSGVFDQSGTVPTVSADFVRDWTLTGEPTTTPTTTSMTVSGRLNNINYSDMSFIVVRSGENDINVVASSSTSITLSGSTQTFNDLASGNEVAVTGDYNSSSNVLTATTIVVASSTDNGGGGNNGGGNATSTVTVSGTVSDTSGSDSVFTLSRSGESDVRVDTSSSTITRDGSSAGFVDIATGDSATVTGAYSSSTNILMADTVMLTSTSTGGNNGGGGGAVDLSGHEFQGELRSFDSTSLPTTLVFSRDDGTEINVNVPSGISIVDSNWSLVPLANFTPGNTVIIYGSAATTTASSTINASVVRNLTLPE